MLPISVMNLLLSVERNFIKKSKQRNISLSKHEEDKEVTTRRMESEMTIISNTISSTNIST